MNFKTTYTLFGVLGALLVVLALVLWVGPSGPPDKAFILPSAQSDAKGKVGVEDVDRVVLERTEPSEEKIVFERTGEGEKKPWRMTEPVEARVDQNAVDTLVSKALEARKDEKADMTKDLKQYDLKDPLVVLTLEAGSRTFKLNLGARSPGKESAVVYVTSSDYPKTPMAVRLSELEYPFKDITEFRSRELFTLGFGDIKGLRVEDASKSMVLASSAGNQWRFVKPAEYGAADYEGASETDAAKPPTGVRALISGVTGLRVEAKADTPDKDQKDQKDKKQPAKDKKKPTGFIEDNAKDLKKYGLESDKDASLVLEVKKDPKVEAGEKLLIGKKVDDKTELYYARRGGEKHVVTVAAKELEVLRNFLKDPQKVRDHDLVKATDKPDVLRINYPDGEVLELFRTAGEARGGFPGAENWTMYRGKETKGQATDSPVVDRLVSTLSQKRQVRDFLPADDKKDVELGLKDPNVTLSLWFNGVKKPEKKDEKKEKDEKDEKKEDKKPEGRPELRSEKPDVELAFGRADAEKLVAVRRRTGADLKEVTRLKVADAMLEVARADSLTYLEKSLPPFFQAPRAVTKVTLEFDGKLTQVERVKPDDEASGWVLKKPADLEGRKADSTRVSEDVLLTLNHLVLQKWVALKPKDEQLSRWGLKVPTGKVTLGMKVDGKPQDVALLVGSLTEDKKDYYARKSDAEAVFTVSKLEIDKLQQPLVDMLVIDFQADDVKAMKVSGWGELLPTGVYTYDLERKSSSDWKAKAPAGLEVNPVHAEKVLRAMIALRALKFLVYKTGPKPEHGLDPKKGALEITLSLEDKDKKKETITLMIGKPEGDGLAASTTKLPGDVFVIPKGESDVFKEVKEKVKYLSK